MRSEWLSLRLQLALIWRGLHTDFSNFHLIHYRKVGGFLVSGKNSGTHWLRYMLSHAIAAQRGLAAPSFSSGPESECVIGHPRRHGPLPLIAGSHNLPSRIIGWRWLQRLLRLPPIVVLVRDPKQAMLSHFVKWRDELGITLHDYVSKTAPSRKQMADSWWYMDFFNRWGRMAERAPDLVMVVRYEDVMRSPALWLERISEHLHLGLGPEAIDAAMAVSSREAVRTTLDASAPDREGMIVPSAQARASVRLSPADDAALNAQFLAHLHYDFGYGLARRSNRPMPAPSGAPRLVWARAAFALAIVYAAFNQIGRPYLSLGLAEPWSRLELISVFSAMALLGPQAFPKLKVAIPALLSVVGGGVEFAQHIHLAPGVGAFSDVAAELIGIAAASVVMVLLGSAAFGQRAGKPDPLSSPVASSAARAAAARPGRHPRSAR